MQHKFTKQRMSIREFGKTTEVSSKIPLNNASLSYSTHSTYVVLSSNIHCISWLTWFCHLTFANLIGNWKKEVWIEAQKINKMLRKVFYKVEHASKPPKIQKFHFSKFLTYVVLSSNIHCISWLTWFCHLTFANLIGNWNKQSRSRTR